jgi:ABC-type branched-subunit amino acid transport system permease subunit
METIIIIILALLALYIVFRIFKTLIKWLFIGLLVVLAIAFFSNPEAANHKKGLKEITKNFPVKIKDSAIQIDDYKIFSITKVKVDGKEKIVGIGAFGKVWYFDDLQDHFKKE